MCVAEEHHDMMLEVDSLKLLLDIALTLGNGQ